MLNQTRETGRTFLFVFAVYCIAWFDLFVPSLRTVQGSALSIRWFLVSALKNTARFAFVSFVATSGFSQVFRMRAAVRSPVTSRGLSVVNRLPAPRPLSILRALGAAAAALAAAAAFSFGRELLATLLPSPGAGAALTAPASDSAARVFWEPRLPFEAVAPGTDLLSAGLLASIALSCLSVGYAEEAFFRFFIVDKFTDSGIPFRIAALLSVVLFGLAHASQGISSVIFATFIAMLFQTLRKKDFDLHALALGHALYDFALLAAWIKYPSG